MSKLIYIFLFYAVAAYARTTKGNFSEEVKQAILKSIAQCANDSDVKNKYLSMIKEGNYSRDPDFIDFVFCSYTKSGYADKLTGRALVEKIVDVYPEQCNMLETVRRCDENARGDSPMTLLFDFFVCFQENTMCPIDLVMGNNTTIKTVSVEKSMESSKRTTKGNFSEEVKQAILKSIAQCANDSDVKNKYLSMIKEGNYSRDPDFIDFVFCSYTKSGYADKLTGRALVEKIADVYPEQCNMLETVRRCDENARGDSPMTLLFDFFVCFQENTMCPIDLVMENNTTAKTVSVEKSMESSKRTTKGNFSEEVKQAILKSIAQCANDSDVKNKYLSMIKEGNYSRDPDFIDFVFCSYTKSGYADKLTGRALVEKIADVYPEQCNMLETVRRCDENARGDSPMTLLFDFFVCFQENTMCPIDLVMENNTTAKTVSVEKSMESSKRTTKGNFSEEVKQAILKSIAQCANDSDVKNKYLSMIKEGNYSRDPDFIDFVFCSYTKSGYADKNLSKM